MLWNCFHMSQLTQFSHQAKGRKTGPNEIDHFVPNTFDFIAGHMGPRPPLLQSMRLAE